MAGCTGSSSAASSGGDGSGSTSSGSSDSSGGTFKGTGNNISSISFTVSGGQLTGLTGDAGFFCYPSGYQVQTFDAQDHTTAVSGNQFDDSFSETVDGQEIDFQLSGTITGSTASGSLRVKRPYCTSGGNWTAQQS